ncbi:MAG: hypothetical protein RLZZ324_657, partial [Candidatus Parcubacteria bacterium]
MKDKRAFLVWSALSVLVVIGAAIGVNLGWLTHIKNDPTHVTEVILGCFPFALAYVGRLAWRLSSGEDPDAVMEDVVNPDYAASFL